MDGCKNSLKACFENVNCSIEKKHILTHDYDIFLYKKHFKIISESFVMVSLPASRDAAFITLGQF